MRGLSGVEGACGARVLVGQGSACGAVVSFRARSEQRSISESWITVESLKTKARSKITFQTSKP